MVADLTDDCTYYKRVNGPWIEIIVRTPTTAATDDTIAFSLPDYGIKTFEAIIGNIQTTAGSIIGTEAPTTSVTTGTLTITVGGTTATDRRVYLITGLA